jgi:tRNA (guanine26-N2/guanine27-N2)-dimethyltransferase
VRVQVRRIKEGLVELELPEDPRLDRVKGPQRAGAQMVFYNPAAKVSRDLTIVVMRALPPPEGGWRVLDGLTGSGVRGLRVAAEVDGVSEVVLNDGEPAATALAQAQVDRLGVKAARVTNRSLDETLADRQLRFDLIDIDPYGSPVRFLGGASARAATDGIIAATATDVAALCGVYPGACVRRYGAAPLHNEWMKETGARILLGAAARKAGAGERSIEPIATMVAEHYIRIMYRVVKGKRVGDRAQEQLGFVKVPSDETRAPKAVSFLRLMKDPEALAGAGPMAGPLWIGPLHDDRVLSKVEVPAWMGKSTSLNKFLKLAVEESALPPWHFDLDIAASKLGGSPPPTRRAVDALKEAGFAASATHFSSKGVKTTASRAELGEVLRGLVPRR